MATIRQPIDYGSGKPADRFARPIGDGPLDQPPPARPKPVAASSPPTPEPTRPSSKPRIIATNTDRLAVEYQVLACLREAAAAKRRCPTAGQISMWMDDRGYGWRGTGGPAAVTKRLALRGRIRINIFGKNFRQIEIIEAPAMETASKPGVGAPWMVIDRRGTVRQ